MEEESIKLKTSKEVFYNPRMHFCRSISSLGVGAIGTKLKIADGFSASGIRGIRYKKENKNVTNVYFIDANPSAVKLTKENLKLNKIKNSKVLEGDFNREIREIKIDLVEIDPFGTPAPYLYDSIRSLKYKKDAFLSITATDAAVLCGPEATACLKNYHSKSLNNEFTHENGLRILLKRIAEVGMEFNFGTEPLFSLSDQHYLKVFLKLTRGEKYSTATLANLGFVSYCFKCGHRVHGKRMENKCNVCNSKMDYTGPVWIGELHNKKFLQKMKSLNKKRNYVHKEQLSKILDLMENEIGFPPYFFDLPQIAKIRKTGAVVRRETAIEELIKKGFRASRTHFTPNGIKTNANIEEIVKIIYP